MSTIPCKCPCGEKIGEFSPIDDHSGVGIKCPKCGRMLRILNGLLREVLDSPEHYDLPLELYE
jgi:hypothetical protein